jgi:hypothetical protein
MLNNYISKALCILAVIATTGCTSLNSVELQPDELQKQIAIGQIIKVGDYVKLFTQGGERVEFTVTEVADNKVKGENIEIAIPSIIALETRDISFGKTALLTSSVSLFTMAMIALASFTTLL